MKESELPLTNRFEGLQDENDMTTNCNLDTGVSSENSKSLNHATEHSVSGVRPVHRKQNIIQQQKNPKQKTTIVLGNSMVKHQKGWDIGEAAGHYVVVKAFSGDMVCYSKPSILQAPDQIILHCADVNGENMVKSTHF
ncbi:Hypothetical predicted protein [Paramuricea clavata]|uniref:Uncharacterized protein n=1 Tax=Paramuricea clavata TaxID=317549 RepID=A0A6S7GBK4_PARCT|nr:Hypothetical predicted protein [Paramuricea clavata]